MAVQAGPEWTIAGTGDFNADGLSDMLWRTFNRLIIDWLSTETSYARFS